MRVNFGRDPDDFATFLDLQDAISDPNMRGTVMIAHGGPGGVIWTTAPDSRHPEVVPESVSPPGFKDARLENNWPLTARPTALRKLERVWLLGCKVGRLKSQWASTFGIAERDLCAPEKYSAGDDPCIAKKTCESTLPRLQEVVTWVKRRKHTR
jgi:hypothetical protein